MVGIWLSMAANLSYAVAYMRDNEKDYTPFFHEIQISFSQLFHICCLTKASYLDIFAVDRRS
jgi:hypothetical protein